MYMLSEKQEQPFSSIGLASSNVIQHRHIYFFRNLLPWLLDALLPQPDVINARRSSSFFLLYDA